MTRESLDNPYNLIAAQYDTAFDETNPYYGPISRREREVFRRWIPGASNSASALDVGCGTGFHTQWLLERGYHTTGVDVATVMLEVAERKFADCADRVDFVPCDALDMSALPAEGFDAVVCLGSSLNHVGDWRQALAEMSRRLKPGGRLIFSFDNLRGLDTLFWLLKRGRGIYSDSYGRRHLVRKLGHALRGLAFHNHMHMEVQGVGIEVPLTYETPARVHEYLDALGLRSEQWVGVHPLTFVSRSIMEASAYVDGNGWPAGGAARRILLRLDDWAARHFYRLSANIVVVASKPDYGG